MQEPKQPDLTQRVVIFIEGLPINTHRHLAPALQHLSHRRNPLTPRQVGRCMSEDGAARFGDQFQFFLLRPCAMCERQAWREQTNFLPTPQHPRGIRPIRPVALILCFV